MTEAQRICAAYREATRHGGGNGAAPGTLAPVVAKPSITWVGAHPEHFVPGRIAPSGAVIAPEAWVNHIAEGSFDGVRTWFNTPTALRNPPLGPSSTHFSIGKDGRIQQHVAVEDTAFGNGDVQAGCTAALVFENSGLNPNLGTVSCEHEGFTGDIPTDAMFDSSTRLCAWVFATYLLPGGASGVAVDRRHILRHGEISPGDRAFCPGWPETVLADYVARVDDLLKGMPEQALAEPLLAFLREHPDVGRPRHDTMYDLYGNAYVWLTACERHPRGALLFYRKWLDRVQLISWEDAPHAAPLPPFTPQALTQPAAPPQATARRAGTRTAKSSVASAPGSRRAASRKPARTRA